MDPRYHKWRKDRGESYFIKGWSIIPRINTPLLFEPGTSWAYGTGLDWAGILVSRLNNLSLEAYMQKYVWAPLGIKNITFHQENHEEVRKNLVKMSIRKGLANPIFGFPERNNEKVDWTDDLLYDIPIADEYGGEGAIGSATDYFKILQSILADDGKLLTSETIDEMFSPQLSEGGVKALDEYNNLPFYQGGGFASVQNGAKVDWGLGGELFLEDYFTGRKKGTLTWSGMTNLQWTIDRKAGICAFYASNLLPFGDFPSGDMQVKFEKEMYARAEKGSKL
jgi:CubicO group peptidase (beta-lactamase class C family)